MNPAGTKRTRGVERTCRAKNRDTKTSGATTHHETQCAVMRDRGKGCGAMTRAEVTCGVRGAGTIARRCRCLRVPGTKQPLARIARAGTAIAAAGTAAIPGREAIRHVNYASQAREAMRPARCESRDREAMRPARCENRAAEATRLTSRVRKAIRLASSAVSARLRTAGPLSALKRCPARRARTTVRRRCCEGKRKRGRRRPAHAATMVLGVDARGAAVGMGEARGRVRPRCSAIIRSSRLRSSRFHRSRFG